VRFDNKSTEKETSPTTSSCPIFFSYMEHPLKPLLKPLHPIDEVVVEVFFKNFPHFVTLKTSTKTFSIRCSPCSVSTWIIVHFSKAFDIVL
jgi:hypothetical protein